MKLAIVGSRAYQNKDRIRKLIENQLDRHGSSLTVVSGGCPNGADYLAKDLCIEMDVPYVEFPPVHSKHNKYCVKSPDAYNKTYNVGNYFSRNTELAEYCDRLVAFVVSGVKANGTMDTVSKAKRLGKPVVVLND